MAPVLETPRLLLRPHTLDDFPATFAMWSDPEVVRFIGGRPFTREEAWARLLRYVGHWTMLGYGMGAGPAGVLLLTLAPLSLPSLAMVARTFPWRVLVVLAAATAVLGLVAGGVAIVAGL